MRTGILLVVFVLAAGCRIKGGDGLRPDAGGDGDSGSVDPGQDDTIYDIQGGRIPATAAVRIAGGVVTAVDGYGKRVGGIYVEEPGGGEYSGVFVYNPTVTGNAVLEPLAKIESEAKSQAVHETRVIKSMGVGKVATYKKNEDGTSDVVLSGESRARVEDWLEGKPYRTARVSTLADVKPRSLVVRDRLKQELGRHLTSILSNHGSREELETLLPVFSRDRDVGFLADFLAYRFLRDPRERQRLLEELDVEKRVELLRDFLSLRGLI